MTASPVLELDDVEAGYGAFRALFGLSFAIHEGEAVALVGPNGAGKTTVARVCSGLVRPTTGSVRIDGVDVTGSTAKRFSAAGIAHAPEGRSVFASLTIQENLTLSFGATLGRSEVKAGLEKAYAAFPRLGERRGQLAGSLSGGEQRMLTMARVLVLQPRLLIADELSLGLAPIVTGAVYEQLAAVREAGTAVLIVEQHLEHALSLADRVIVLDTGVIAYDGPVGDVAEHVALGTRV
jgi:branched-chain amino acid transport system ATP-binding protein